MALSDEIQDAITRHQIYILRYSAGREKEAAEYIERITRLIEEELEVDELTSMDVFRLRRFQEEIGQFSSEVFEELGTKIIDDATDLIQLETEWTQSIFEQFLGEPISLPSNLDAQLAVFTNVLAVGGAALSVRNMVNQFRQNKVRQVIQNIRDGITLREPNEEVKVRVKNMESLQKKHAGNVIRTITNHVSVASRDVLMRDNPDYFEGYEWVSILDSRTSIICASRDGTVYPFTDDPIKSPKPPAHFNCRSTITPKVKPEYEDKVKKREPRTAEGAKGKTKVRQTTTYESWLRRQPVAFQNEVLGVTRAKLFRIGKLPISKFVDMSGKTLTLDELRKIEPEVFNRVKL